jgi:hypothetical protein
VPAAGWYEDPDHEGRLRWWDGGQWTADTRAMPPGAGALSEAEAAAVETPQPRGPQPIDPAAVETEPTDPGDASGRPALPSLPASPTPGLGRPQVGFGQAPSPFGRAPSDSTQAPSGDGQPPTAYGTAPARPGEGGFAPTGPFAPPGLSGGAGLSRPPQPPPPFQGPPVFAPPQPSRRRNRLYGAIALAAVIVVVAAVIGVDLLAKKSPSQTTSHLSAPAATATPTTATTSPSTTTAPAAVKTTPAEKAYLMALSAAADHAAGSKAGLLKLGNEVCADSGKFPLVDAWWMVIDSAKRLSGAKILPTESERLVAVAHQQLCAKRRTRPALSDFSNDYAELGRGLTKLSLTSKTQVEDSDGVAALACYAFYRFGKASSVYAILVDEARSGGLAITPRQVGEASTVGISALCPLHRAPWYAYIKKKG